MHLTQFGVCMFITYLPAQRKILLIAWYTYTIISQIDTLETVKEALVKKVDKIRVNFNSDDSTFFSEL